MLWGDGGLDKDEAWGFLKSYDRTQEKPLGALVLLGSYLLGEACS
jgi:hypothetical protein